MIDSQADNKVSLKVLLNAFKWNLILEMHDLIFKCRVDFSLKNLYKRENYTFPAILTHDKIKYFIKSKKENKLINK